MTSTIFSELKQISWDFSIGCRTISLTCVSTSEEEARLTMINFITKIDTLTKNYRIAKENNDWAKMKEYAELFNYSQIDANLNIGCFGPQIYDFHLDMKIEFSEGKTLATFINTIKPNVRPFYLISVYSYND